MNSSTQGISLVVCQARQAGGELNLCTSGFITIIRVSNLRKKIEL